MKKVFDSLKYIKIKDIVAPFIFLFAIIPALIYKVYLTIMRKPLWLICEDGNTARDNGFYFYRYMRTNHTEVNCRYVIRKNSCDYKKIIKLGLKPIQTSSFKHYISYLAAKWNISNQKMGNPNQVLFYIIHVSLGLLRNRVFLQHGITKDDSPWIYYKNTKFRYFICGAKREYDYVREKFGYPEGSVALTGFSRFDTLIDNSKNKNQILIMPTWRNWLGRETNFLSEQEKITETDYFKKWNAILSDKDFIDYLEKNGKTAVFYPHANMQKFIGDFNVVSNRIKVAKMDYDIQKALRESELLITDYSSVFMDFAYMRKPVIYYQFDYDRYRKEQLQEGYFDYARDGFGPIYADSKEIVKHLGCPKECYKKRSDSFFGQKDTNNSKRIFELLSGGSL